MYLMMNPAVAAGRARVDGNFIAEKDVPFKVSKADAEMLLERVWKGTVKLFVVAQAPKPKPKPQTVEVNTDDGEKE